MSDVAMALMKALGISKGSPTPAAALTPQEEAAPWLVPQGGGAGAQGGRPQMAAAAPEDAPVSPQQASRQELDDLVAKILKQKQMAAAAGGQPIPR